MQMLNDLKAFLVHCYRARADVQISRQRRVAREGVRPEEPTCVSSERVLALHVADEALVLGIYDRDALPAATVAFQLPDRSWSDGGAAMKNFAVALVGRAAPEGRS